MVIDSTKFRQAMSAYASGITVITGFEGDEPVGMTCQSFASLSIDPPLVLFCPARSSSSWPRINDSKKFCVNVLSNKQLDLCTSFAKSGGDKFTNVEWEKSLFGLPVISNVLVAIECEVHEIYDGGDHEIVIGLVKSLTFGQPDAPLIYHQSNFFDLTQKES
jgi:3-hydroxy-9,10-secoandrosta-1,3,5(10)-triene-9,17-dione monooxygenase reductase component